MATVSVALTQAELRIIRRALRIAAEDGSLTSENLDGTPNKTDQAVYERAVNKIESCIGDAR